jgi:GntR family transcriptional regulator
MRWDEANLDEGPVPLWSQIADRLRKAMASGAFKPGDALPGEAEINRRFGVSRSTSRAALDHLETQGLIRRRSGLGSIVIEPRVERSLNRLSSFSEDMRMRGLTPSYRTKSIALVAATAAVAAELKVEEGAPVVEIDRILLADGTPMATSLTYLPPSVFAGSGLPDIEVLDRGSLYARLRSAGVFFAGGDERIEGALADRQTARELGVRQPAAVLVCRRTSWATDGRPLEHVILNYLADRYSFQVKLVQQ